MQRAFKRHSATFDKKEKLFEADYAPERYLDKALEIFEYEFSGFLFGLWADIQKSLRKSNPSFENHHSYFSFLKTQLADRIWEATGLLALQPVGGPINPFHNQVYSRRDLQSNSWLRITKVEPDHATERFVYSFEAANWPQQLLVIQRLLGDEHTKQIEDSFRERAAVSSPLEVYIGSIAYQFIVYFGTLEKLTTVEDEWLFQDGHRSNYEDGILLEMRDVHSLGGRYATIIENQLAKRIIEERIKPRDTLSNLWLSGESSGQDSEASTACLKLLEELAPATAKQLASYAPADTVYSFAADILAAPPDALRKLSQVDRIRALKLLNHYKFSSRQIGKRLGTAIALISATTPLGSEKKEELRQIANEYLDRIGISEIAKLDRAWPTMRLEQKHAVLADWHDHACDVMGLPCKQLKLIDADSLNDDEKFPVLGFQSLRRPLTLAAGAVTCPPFMYQGEVESLGNLAQVV